MIRSIFLSALFAVGAFAQATAVTDADTGITFSTWFDSTGYSFGYAMPETPESDFIGRIVAPVTVDGYAGVSLGGNMVNKLLIVAWPHGDTIVSSFRQATGYSAPEVYSGPASPKMLPISKGTFVNSTHFSYTFLCKGCILSDATTFTATADMPILGFAVSSIAVSDPSSNSATLSQHDTFGNFGLQTALAKSTDYASWAALASETPVPGGNTTVPAPGGNTTIPAPGGNSTIPGNSTCSNTSATTPATVYNATFDYIVAGGGPAGIITAQRLAESGKSVLLVERGSASTFASGGPDVLPWNDTVTPYDVPGMAYYLTSTKSVIPHYCNDVPGMAGCLLGGGTMMNALMYVRPQDADFNKWPVGWQASDMQSAMTRLYERNPGTTLSSVDGKRYDQSVFETMSSVLNSNGWKQADAIAEPNVKHQMYSYPPWDARNGLRGGPVSSYLPLAQANPNFELKLNTKVIRVVRDGALATGIEVETSSGRRQIINVKTGGKVILSSGAMSTPRILFNSGIGPSDQIRTAGAGCAPITLPQEQEWINLPVGVGIKDHPIFELKFVTSNTTRSNFTTLPSTAFTSPSQSDVELFRHGSGVLSQSGQRLIFWSSAPGPDGVTRFYQGTCAPTTGGFKVKLYLTHGATSSGALTLDPSGTGSTVLSIDPLMNTEADRTAVADFIDSFLASVSNSSLISYATGKTGTELIPTYVSGSHFVNSARMGLDDGRKNGTSVVDTDTKVYGMDNLFVVDASIHPDLPTGNTQAIVMVVAEKAAERILALDDEEVIAIPAPCNGTAAPTGVVPTGVAPTGTGTAVRPTRTPVTRYTRPKGRRPRGPKARRLAIFSE